MAGRTIHFEGHYKNSPDRGTVPFCTRWAMRPSYGVTTTDKTKVTCTRCAKQLGITPAPKVDLSVNKLGTCACCFAPQKVRAAAGTMFHHGYERKGYGYIIGPCIGHSYLPYEKSCEGTKYMLHLACSALRETRREIEYLETTNTLHKSVRVEAMHCRNYKWEYREEDIVLTKGAPETVIVITSSDPSWNSPMYGLYGRKYVYSFDGEQRIRLENARSLERQILHDIKFFEQKITEWKLDEVE